MADGPSGADPDLSGYVSTLLHDRVYSRPRDEVLLRICIYGGGVFLTLFTIWHAWASDLPRDRFSNYFLGIGLGLYYLVAVLELYEDDGVGPVEEPPSVDDRPVASDGGEAIRPGDGAAGFRSWSFPVQADAVLMLLSAVAALAASAYVELHWERLTGDAFIAGTTQLDHLVGLVIILLVVDATRRAFGGIIASVAVVGIAYAQLGPWMPGVLRHTGMEWEQLIRNAAIGMQGVYSFILEIGATWVAIFIMFAGLAKAYGLMDFVLDVGSEIGNVLQTGVVQIAVIASMIMGSITGSAAANTATTGSFTIPMLKNQGIRKDFACAIESVASSGGQMLPPIMGVAAFLMADMIDVPYVSVLRAGLIPAILFYFSVGVAVHLVVHRFGWTTAATGSFDRRLLLEGIHFAIPLGVLLYTLVVLRFTPLPAGFYTILAIIPTAFGKALVDDGVGVRQVSEFTVTTFDGFRIGATDMAPLVGMLAALGIIIQMIQQTGLDTKISVRMIALAGGVMVLLLVMAMITSILFGLGMPTPAAYLIVAILIAKPLTNFGIPQITAHMFVFYFAMLSAITPPVAVAVAVGCRIAESDFIRSSVQALRIGAPGFVIPFAFVTNDSLITWSYPETVIAFPPVLVGVVALVVATIGYDGTGVLGYPHRAGYLVLTAGALFGPLPIQVAAAVLVVLSVYLSSRGRMPSVLAPRPPEPDQPAPEQD